MADPQAPKISNKVRFNLAFKIILISAPVFILFLVLVGKFSEKLLENQILESADELLLTMSRHEAARIDAYFKRIEDLGHQSADVLKDWLIKSKNATDRDFEKKYKLIDGALRTNLKFYNDKNVPGVFLSNLTTLNKRIKEHIIGTESQFAEYAKGAKSLVFNMYLITQDQLIVIYEKDWALEIEPDHDFNADIFYKISTPENNPERKGKWTDPYYDSIWKRWMISLITPIYIEDEFIGIVGHDVILNDIYDDIVSRKYYESGFGFIFDENRNLVVHPKYLEELEESAEMGTLLSQNKFGDNMLIKLITDIVDLSNNNNTNKKVYDFEGATHYIYTTKLNILNWYYSIEVTEIEFLKFLPEFRSKFLFQSIIGTMVLFVIVVLVMMFLIVKPIKRLKLATENVMSGDIKQTVDVRSRDEIGNLTNSFNHMVSEINTKISEVNAARDNYRSILINSAEGIFQSSVEGRFLKINPAGAKILGYDNERDLINSISSISEQLYVETSDRFEFLERIKKADHHSHSEIQVKKKDGSLIWVELRERGVKDKEGNILYIEGFFNDITERKRAEETLTLSNTILKAQQETSPDGILIVDEELRTVDYNSRFLEMWGIPELIMKTKSDEEARKFVSRKLVDPEKFNERVLHLYHNPNETSYDVIELKGNIFFERYSSPLISKDGKNLGRIWYFHDISESRKVQTDLIEAKEKAEHSEKLKSEFLAQVSHEIRTPINTVLSFSQLMKEEIQDKIDDDLKDGFRTIDHAGRRIIRTIDLILNMSELQSGTYEYISRPINIYEEIILNIYSEYNHIVKEKKIELEIKKLTDSFLIVADEYTVTQIFSNLLDNAIKYTMQGSVIIIIERDVEDALIVEIKDTGIGIAEEYFPYLFKEFTQEEQGYTRKYEGNGLGLALVKKYCELNNAEISFESAKGVGTTFRVRFLPQLKIESEWKY